jgi:hypothetical protein
MEINNEIRNNEIIEMECEKEKMKDNYNKTELKVKENEKEYTINIFSKKKKAKENYIGDEINSISEKNDVSDNKYKLVNNKCISIGVVIYLEKKFYDEDKEKNKNIHIRDADPPSILALLIKKCFEDLYKIPIKQLVLGHEHGDENNKCHLQMIIIFEKIFNKVLNPGAIKIIYDEKSTNLIYMQQKTFNVYALTNYCKKERRATIINKNNKMRRLEINELIDYKDNDISPFDEIVENADKLTIEEARKKLIEYNSTGYFKNANNYETALKRIIATRPEVPFKWMDPPEYLKDFTIAGGFNFLDVFMPWYQKYCINGENLERKKALCLFSEERSMGKSYFVRHLVSDPAYLLEYNNNFTEKPGIGKGIYKLLLLDDMKIIDDRNLQIWKSLVASEPTTIRDAWCNQEFKERLPCIITTNDLEMLAIFKGNKLFNTQVLIIEIEKYMGAPGTERDDLRKHEYYLSDDVNFKINNLLMKKRHLFNVKK